MQAAIAAQNTPGCGRAMLSRWEPRRLVWIITVLTCWVDGAAAAGLVLPQANGGCGKTTGSAVAGSVSAPARGPCRPRRGGCSIISWLVRMGFGLSCQEMVPSWLPPREANFHHAEPGHQIPATAIGFDRPLLNDLINTNGLC